MELMTFGYHDIERAAMSFILETQIWPVFIKWLDEQAVTEEAREWANGEPNVAMYRRLWIEHCPDPVAKAIMLEIYDGRN